MTTALAAATLALALAVFLLALSILAIRLVHRTRRRRERALRPAYEEALARYLALDDAAPPAVPERPAARLLLRDVTVNAIVELRGRERKRLTALVEQLGLVAEAAAELRSRSRRRRRRAADALAALGSRTVREALLRGLGDRDRHVRLACARALAESGDEDGVARALATIDTDFRESRGEAAEILLALGARRPTGLAHLLAPGPLPELRRLAAAVAGELRLLELAPHLRAAATDADDELAAVAAGGLGSIGDTEAVAPLLALLAGDRPPLVRAAAVRALGAIGDADAVPALERALRADEWSLRASAAEALALLGPRGEEALRRALAGEPESIRAHARAALAP